jgi:transposase-like protein
MFLERGFVFTHEAVREWESRFAPLLAEKLRARRQGQASSSWYVDETYIRVNGLCCYLYRAIDREGKLVDTMLSQTRDMGAAQRFFQQARVVAGQAPTRVTTDGHASYPRAIGESLGETVEHRCSQYLNNRIGKTSAASGSATSPCAGSAASRRRRASAGPLISYDSSNVIGRRGRSEGHWWNDGNASWREPQCCRSCC